MLATAAGAASIVAPGHPHGGLLPPGSTGVFPVAVGDLENAEGVTFNLTFDNTLLSVEGVVANDTIPGSEVVPNIDNIHGWVNVSVTNSQGITAGENWPLPPLVDITFRATENEGESAVEFAGTPTYSQNFEPVYFDSVYDDGSIAVRDPSTIWAPSGTLAYGQPGTFAVGVDNVTGATEISFELMYDGSYLIVDDIAIAPDLPGAVITSAQAMNGVPSEYGPYELGEFGLESVPEEIRQNIQQTPHHYNFAWVTVEIPDGLTVTDYTEIVDFTFRPTNLTGTSEITTYANWDVGEEWHYFDLEIPGQIATSGGGSYPGLGELRAPSATIDAGSQKVLPLMVRSLNAADSAYVWAEWNSTVINVTSVSLNATAQGAGVTLDNCWYGSYYNEPTGYLNAYLGNMSNLNTASWTPVLDLMVKANTTSGQTPMTISGTAYTIPRENVLILHPAATLEDGVISVVTAQKADLRGTLIDPLRYVKKYADDSLHFTQTMVIENIGVKPVTEDFKIQGEFGSSKADITVSDDIAPGANITYHMTVHVVPGYGETDIILTDKGAVKEYEITTAGNVAVGDYSIGLGIDVDNTVDEINEENNYVQTRAEITRPDLVPVWEPVGLVSGIPSSNTTILEASLAPGTWTVKIGARNDGNVYALPTTLHYSVNGGTPKPYSVPRLEPGENWTTTVNIDVGRTAKTYRVEVNVNRTEEAETDYTNNVYTGSVGSGAPVTVVLPEVFGSSADGAEVAIWITNVSSPVTAFQIPLIYDPTVCYNSSPVETIQGVTVTTSYGRITLTGTDLPALTSDAQIATFTMKARTDSGRTSLLDSQTNAYVKTTDGAYLELEIVRGKFVQENKTDAAVSVFASPSGSANQSQTISVTVQNRKSNPVTVTANLTVDNGQIWEMQDISLAGRASRTFTVNTWKPAGGTYTLNAAITGDDDPAGNTASRNIVIDNYDLEVTDQNKQYWGYWYDYNKSVLKNEYFVLGTYFTTNQAGMVNATVAVTYPDGTPVDLTDNSVFEFHYYYPAEQSVYAYNSEWNSVSWYYIQPKQLGTFNYSITLEAKGKSAYVNGTIKVREPNVDIKVMNTTLVTNEASKTLEFPVFARTPSEGQKVQLLLGAGADGRTIQGLTSLIGYPHGCPEQTMSPAFVALRVKQYYAERGALTPEINQTILQTMQNALDRMNVPNGDNAQQLAGQSYGDGSGGWAWGKSDWSTPSMFYTFYTNYVITELLMDMDADPGFWNVDTNMNGIDLNASANWLIQKQKVDGNWQDWGYISNDVEWTGFISENLVNEYPYLNETMQGEVNSSLQRSCAWMQTYDYSDEDTQALSYAILGLIAIRDHGIGDAAAINVKIDELELQLQGKKVISGTESYWNDETKWDTYEPTASAVLALYSAGVDPADLSSSISHLIGNRAGRSYSGGWGSTRTSAAVINTLTNVVPQGNVDFTVDVEIKNPADVTVWSRNDISFNQNSFSFVHELTEEELGTLYGFGAPNGTATVIISGKTDADPAKIAKLSVSIDSFEQVPESIALATIPEKYIDPIATDFDLQIVAPAPGDLEEGDSWDVGFTVNNNYADSIDQSVMIIEIPISNAVNFTGSALGSDTAYYLSGGETKRISHMYNATAKVLYIYPGSDDESRPSVLAGESKTFFVPLKFGTSGNITVEARVYPMYNDTWMALGSGGTYVMGYGNVTLAAVDENDAPVNAEFYVNGASVASGVSTYNARLLEDTYPVAIRKDSVWINSSVNVAPSESVTYTAHFASDTSVPYIAQAEGTAGEIRIMPPAIEDTTDNASTSHWNAATKAMKSFNSTIASSGGRATISVEIPTLTRNIGTAELNDTVVVMVHNASGWFTVPSSGYSLAGGVLTLFNIDTADVDEISIGFEGRLLGDVTKDGRIRLNDAIAIAQSLVPGEGGLTGNARIYGDVDNSGNLRLQDAITIAQYLIPGQYDDNYQPL
ncbi:CARDB domain-containing protein [Methanoculleus sp.]|uniref:CARDB domain-containing protein n=1 Tax=Methanoculleus sp. TaxID=90427 RepID=UPI002FCB7C3F